MSYDFQIQSDYWSTISVPVAQVLSSLQSIDGTDETSPGSYEVAFGGCTLSLGLDEVDDEGNSIEFLRREENNEPWTPGFMPENVNLISASMPYGLDAATHFEGVSVLWHLADALGWRVLDHQQGRFLRPRYDSQVFLPELMPVAEVHRRMALSLWEAGHNAPRRVLPPVPIMAAFMASGVIGA